MGDNFIEKNRDKFLTAPSIGSVKTTGNINYDYSPTLTFEDNRKYNETNEKNSENQHNKIF